VNLKPAEQVLSSLVAGLASKPLPATLEAEIRALGKQLCREPESSSRAIACLLDDDAFDPEYPRVLRYFGWTTLAHYLRPVIDAFNKWREEEGWLRGYCPICGSAPSMSQLVGIDPGRRRLLSCGCCRTLWRFRRIGCPFCEGGEGHRLAVLAIEGEERLRIDYCESCRAYLKTYVGEGNEQLFLADWTSLHLDVLSGNRGLKRLASSLYEL
jgi:FdhE protein